ncbi:MAG: alpha/beta hydrolase, partial [Proteobacteria bacterium]|nr:alpha/beta hydrolase [Pseudomonadota bacterium]
MSSHALVIATTVLLACLSAIRSVNADESATVIDTYQNLETAPPIEPILLEKAITGGVDATTEPIVITKLVDVDIKIDGKLDEVLWAEIPVYISVTPQVSYGSVQSLQFGEPSSVEQYGRNNQQFGQLWLPAGMAESIPLVVFIHGGCWLSDYDIAHTQALSTALSGQGYAVWSIEYRRVGNPGGGWPGTFQDIANAVDHVRGLAERYSLDLNRIALMGHSAGGHLALWAASRKGFSNDNPFYSSDPLGV